MFYVSHKHACIEVDKLFEREGRHLNIVIIAYVDQNITYISINTQWFSRIVCRKVNRCSLHDTGVHVKWLAVSTYFSTRHFTRATSIDSFEQ